MELICIDDGSSDGTLRILEKWAAEDQRIRVFAQTHTGPGGARNLGIEKAVGEYILFVDSDDLMLPNAVELLMQTVEQNDLDALYFDGAPFYDQNCGENELLFRPFYSRRGSYEGVMSGQELFVKFSENNEFIVVIWLTCIRRDLIIKNRIRFHPNIVHGDNMFTWLVIMNAERAMHIPDRLYMRRIRPGSIMTTRKSFKNAYGYYVNGNYMQQYFQEHKFEYSSDCKLYVTDFISRMMRYSKNAFQQIDAFERGRALALGDEYIWFRTLIAEPAEAALRKNEINGQRKIGSERGKALQNEVSVYRADIESIYQSESWRVGNLLIQPFHLIKKLIKG